MALNDKLVLPRVRVLKRIFLLLAWAVVASAQSVDSAALDALVDRTLKAWEVPGAAVAVVRGDELVYLKGFGVKRLASSERVTPDTLFAIGSTTKAFTTAAMAILVDEGKMGWDDPVRKHVPYFRLSDPLANENVTMRDIVCHRTGLSRNDLLWYGSPWGREEIIRRIGLVKLTQPFRSRYQYQNIMFLTAGYAVGRIADTTWESFVQKRLFEPLGMKSANFSTIDAEKAPDHASPHAKRQKKVQVIEWRNIDNIGPAGSINAGVRDLSKWVRMQLADGIFEGRRIVSEKNLHETHIPQMAMRMEDSTRSLNSETNMLAYGLGWTIQDYRGRHMVSHGGAIDGFRANITLMPKEKLGVVVLSNVGSNNMPEALRFAIVDAVRGLGKTDWNRQFLDYARKQDAESAQRRKDREAKVHKGTKPSLDLTAYTGAYEEPAYGTARISVTEGALWFEWGSFKTRLEHVHFDVFTTPRETGGPLDDTRVQFMLNADGEIDSLRTLDTGFRRIKDDPKK